MKSLKSRNACGSAVSSVSSLTRYERDSPLFPKKCQLALIDDDPVFQIIMGHQAELDQMSLDCLPGFDKRRDTSLLKEADVIILDFELAGIQAPQLIAEFKRLDIKASILVISQDPGHKENLTHDLKVQAFLPKSVGYAAIFHAAEKISWQRRTDALR